MARALKITAFTMNFILFVAMLLFMQSLHGADLAIACALATTPILSIIALGAQKSIKTMKMEKQLHMLRLRADIKELEDKLKEEEER